VYSPDDMAIFHDGAEFARIDKVAVIGQWNGARDNPRVCWEQSRLDTNCCVCEKCTRSTLCFGALDSVCSLGPPNVTDERIPAWRDMEETAIAQMRQIVKRARVRGIEGSSVQALHSLIMNQVSYIP
jgi:hypothetical protein